MTTPPDHLTVTTSDRGFGRLPAIPGTYGGDVRVYESSAAMGPHMWLNVTASDKTVATLHLTLADAVKLSEQLAYLAAHHYQLDTDPNFCTRHHAVHYSTRIPLAPCERPSDDDD